MFKGEKKGRTAMDSPERLNRLVEGTNVEGNLSTESNLRVDGSIDGNIQCKGKFVLGQTGKLKGNLTALESEVEGTIIGDLAIDDLLVLRKTAVIQGKITTGRLVIEDGAQLGGSIETADLPKKMGNTVTKKSNSEPTEVVY